MLLSKLFDHMIEKIEELAVNKYWLIIITALLCVIVVNGIGSFPDRHYQRVSENPFETRADIAEQNTFQETLLLPLLAFYTGLNSPTSFLILCFVFILGGYWLWARLSRKRLGAVSALVVSVLLVASPLTTILLSWLGTSDSLTFLLAVPFLFIQSTGLIFVLSFFGATNHIVFLIAIMEVLVMRLLAKDHIRIHHLLFAFLGGVLGYFVVKYFLIANQIQVVSRLDFIFTYSLNSWAKFNLAEFPAIFWSFFNVQWLIFPVCLWMFYKKHKIFYLTFLALTLCNYGITFFSLDTSRIFSLLSWGIFFQCIIHSLDLAGQEANPEWKDQFLKALLVIGLTSLFSFRYFTWNGVIETSPFYEFLIGLIR